MNVLKQAFSSVQTHFRQLSAKSKPYEVFELSAGEADKCANIASWSILFIVCETIIVSGFQQDILAH